MTKPDEGKTAEAVESAIAAAYEHMTHCRYCQPPDNCVCESWEALQRIATAAEHKGRLAALREVAHLRNEGGEIADKLAEEESKCPTT